MFPSPSLHSIARILLLTAFAAAPTFAALVPEGTEHTILSSPIGNVWSLAATPTSFAVAFEEQDSGLSHFHVLDASAQLVSTVTIPEINEELSTSFFQRPIVRAWSGGIWVVLRRREVFCCSSGIVHEGIVGRRYDAAGAPLALSDTAISPHEDNQLHLSLIVALSNQAYLGKGRWILHFRRDRSDGGPLQTVWTIRRFQADGELQPLFFAVDLPAESPGVAITEDTHFLTLTKVPASPPEIDLVGDIYGAGSQITAGPIEVTPESYDNGTNPVVTFSLPDGGFGVAYHQGDQPWIFRLFNGDGSPRTDAEWVDDPTKASYSSLQAAVGQAGEIVFVGSDTAGVWARLYDADGQSMSARVPVSAGAGGHDVQVVAAPNGRFLAGWIQPGSPATLRGRFLAGPTLFANGFESGDTSAWAFTLH